MNVATQMVLKVDWIGWIDGWVSYGANNTIPDRGVAPLHFLRLD